MAGKKKVKKKAKKAKEGNPDEEQKEENLPPEYIDPKLAFPEVDIEIKLASPPNIDELSKSNFYAFSRIFEVSCSNENKI